MTHEPAPADLSVKIPHLVLGLLYLGVAGIWALGVSHLVTLDRLGLLAPAVLVLAGVVGLVASLATARRSGAAPGTPVDD